MKRRTFLKSGMLITTGLPLVNSCRFFSETEQQSSDHLFSLFTNPPTEAKPFVRWWWNGNRLSKKEILRQLDVMKAGGIGGVEINSIALAGDADTMDIPALQWLSPEWIEMVKIALKGAEERGMICDIIVGSGWPFGGEFLTKEEQTQLLTLTSRKVKGAGSHLFNVKELLDEAEPHVHSKYEGQTMELYDIRLAPLEMDTFAPRKRLLLIKMPNLYR